MTLCQNDTSILNRNVRLYNFHLNWGLFKSMTNVINLRSLVIINKNSTLAIVDT